MKNNFIDGELVQFHRCFHKYFKEVDGDDEYLLSPPDWKTIAITIRPRLFDGTDISDGAVLDRYGIWYWKGDRPTWEVFNGSGAWCWSTKEFCHPTSFRSKVKDFSKCIITWKEE